MCPIKLISDSTSEIPLEEAKKLGVEVVPLYVHFKDEVLKDRVEISPEEFYERMREVKGAEDVPHTSEATEEDFLDAYEKWLPKGYDIIVTTLSRLQSKTYESAVKAKEKIENSGEFKGRKIVVYDTLLTSSPVALLNYEIINMINSGHDMQNILYRLDEVKNRLKFYFMVPSLKFLMLGGRIGKAKALVAHFFKIKPILTLENGIVAPLDKIRGSRKELIKWLKKKMHSELPKNKGITVVVGNVDNVEDAEEIKEFVLNEFKVDKLYEFKIGAIIGVHVGPGTVSIAYYVTSVF